MMNHRFLIVFIAGISCWRLANAQESTFVDLSAEATTANTLQTNALMMSRFPSTLSLAVSLEQGYLRTVDMTGKVWQWQLASSPEPELIASTNSEPCCTKISIDGQWLAFAEHAGGVTIMNLASKQIAFRFEPDTANTVALQFSNDATRLAGVTSEGKVTIWELGSGDVIGEYATQPSAVQSIAFSPDAKMVAVASFTAELKLFEIGEDQKSSNVRSVRIGNSKITTIAFTPDGKRIVIAAADGATVVQDLVDQEKRTQLKSHPFAIWSMAFDEDGARLVAGSWDGSIRMWDTRSWRIIQQLKSHEESVTSMVLGDLGLISAGMDGRLLYWPTQAAGMKQNALIVGPKNPVWVSTYSPDGKQVFLGGRDERFELWNLEQHKQVFSRKGHSTTRCAVFSADGTLLVTGGDDREIWVTSTQDGEVRYKLTGHPGALSTLLFVDEGQTLVSGCDAGVLKFWDLATRTETASKRRHKQQLYCAAVSPDQKLLVTGGGHWAKGDPGELIVWDLPKKQFKTALWGHRLTVWSIVFSQDGKWFATSDSAGEVKIWDTQTFQETRALTNDMWIRPLALSPDGNTLAVGRGDGSVRLWDTKSWTEQSMCSGNESFTFWLEFSPDGKTLSSAGNDGTVRFWELP
jgi:eukaryotic-like serine/threonine-protein kinase